MEPTHAEATTATPEAGSVVAPGIATAPNDVASRITRVADGIVHFIARHWLALFNTAWGLYVLLPFAAAILLHMGLDIPARAIYTLYSFLCHQLPDHSYFLFGSSFAPNEAALVAAGMPNPADLFIQRAFVGNSEVGFKVALCQRDVAIYASVLFSGLLFATMRKRVRPLRFRYFLIAMIPMAIDGGTQLFGWRESNWWLRTLTGALFGAAAVWWAYPYIDEAMEDVLVNEVPRPPAG